MKKVFSIFLILGFLYSCNIRNENVSGNEAEAMKLHSRNDTTSVQLIDSVFAIGKIKEGENASFSFRFKNTGQKPLVISSANASCGCTVPEKPEQPIMPGETGFIKVVFHSKGRIGPIQKEVQVVSNAYPEIPVLHLTGEVLAQ
jgi:hypothetical protein